MTRPERKPAVGVEQHWNKHLAGENSAGRKYRKSKYEDLDRLACLKYEDLGRSAFCAKKNIDQVGGVTWTLSSCAFDGNNAEPRGEVQNGEQ